jgi:hypothetical protein
MYKFGIKYYFTKYTLCHIYSPPVSSITVFNLHSTVAKVPGRFVRELRDYSKHHRVWFDPAGTLFIETASLNSKAPEEQPFDEHFHSNVLRRDRAE